MSGYVLEPSRQEMSASSSGTTKKAMDCLRPDTLPGEAITRCFYDKEQYGWVTTVFYLMIIDAEVGGGCSNFVLYRPKNLSKFVFFSMLYVE